jgi:Flp pilus assembly protein TadG
MRIQTSKERRGAYVVELAFVVMILIMVLFGIFEYGRFIFIRQMVTNAAREGARYAVVNTMDATIVADTQAQVKKRMSGVDQTVKKYDCQVYLADETGKNIGPAANAGFGSYIAVQIDCDYEPVLPSLLFLDQTIHISTKALMYSEAN